MAMPPLLNSKGTSYLELLISNSQDILKENNLHIDISTYEETIKALYNLEFKNVMDAWQLSMELNAWSDYFSDFRSNCKRILSDLEAEKLSIVASASINADKNKVSNGDRLANKNENVVEIRKKRNVMQALCDMLDSKIDYLERAHYICKKTFELANEVKD